MLVLGTQVAADLSGCDRALLDDAKRIESLMLEAARVCGATVVGQMIHHFNPIGVSGVVVIAESHLAIHTWPEHGFAALDIFTCGDRIDPMVAVDFLKQAMAAKDCRVESKPRGVAETSRSVPRGAPG